MSLFGQGKLSWRRFFKMLRLILQALPFLVLSYSAQVLMKRGVNSIGVITWSSVASNPVGVISSLVFNKFVILAFITAGIGAITYLVLLSQHDLTVVFPILSALALLILPIVGYVFLGEPVSLRRIAGTIVVVVGMIIVSGS
jgi:drug/metabolite transporter (DMT)-like permease